MTTATSPSSAPAPSPGPALAGDEEPLLEVEDLRTSFFVDGVEYRAVDRATFTLGRGRILALVGESGCGKSVTAYAILRLIRRPGRIVCGRIAFHDAGPPPRILDLTALGEKDELLYHLRGGLASMIFQEPMTALSPVHTIGNQVCEAILLHQDLSRDEADGLAIEMLGKVGIPGPRACLCRYPHELSGGMRQRVVIAMALVCRPQLLIADEPTTALDVTTQAQILELIRGLQSELGTAVMLITHDLGVVAQTAEDVAVMYLGRIVEYGGVRQILKDPRHPYTRSLLASLPGISADAARLPSIRGSVPMLSDIPPGCPFHPRCDHYEPERCDRGTGPELEDCGGGRRIACLRWRELL